MDPLGGNPFVVFTFIAAPAVMTNAAAVMRLTTANRLARAAGRRRGYEALFGSQPSGRSSSS